MPVNPVAENVLGTIGTVLWCIQLIPQIWKSWREKSTAGLSQFLVLLWGMAGLPLGVYALLQDFNIPLIVQPQLFGFLALFSWGQCLYYDKKFSARKAALIAGTVMAVEGGLEAGIYFAVHPSMNQRAIQFFGVLTSVLIALGLLPQYWEIFQRREVVGISIPFITVDLLGGVFSLLSLVFRPKFDALAGVAYSLVVAMDALVVIAAMILNPIVRRRRRREASEQEGAEQTPPRREEPRTFPQNSTMSSSATLAADCKPAQDPEKALTAIEEPY